MLSASLVPTPVPEPVPVWHDENFVDVLDGLLRGSPAPAPVVVADTDDDSGDDGDEDDDRSDRRVDNTRKSDSKPQVGTRKGKEPMKPKHAVAITTQDSPRQERIGIKKSKSPAAPTGPPPVKPTAVTPLATPAAAMETNTPPHANDQGSGPSGEALPPEGEVLAFFAGLNGRYYQRSNTDPPPVYGAPLYRMDSLSAGTCYQSHLAVVYSHQTSAFRETTQRFFANARSHSGTITRRLGLDDFVNVEVTTVPSLGHIVDVFVDHFGYSDEFIRRLDRARRAAQTVDDFARYLPDVAALEIEWFWFFIDRPFFGPFALRARYAAIRRNLGVQ